MATKTKSKKKVGVKDYPIIDEHRKHYALMPVQGHSGKWRGAEVVEGGYLNPFDNPAKIDFETECDCQTACDIHNKFHNFDMTAILDWSFASSVESDESY